MTEPARVFATVVSTRPTVACATATETGLGRVAYHTAPAASDMAISKSTARRANRRECALPPSIRVSGMVISEHYDVPCLCRLLIKDKRVEISEFPRRETGKLESGHPRRVRGIRKRLFSATVCQSRAAAAGSSARDGMKNMNRLAMTMVTARNKNTDMSP